MSRSRWIQDVKATAKLPDVILRLGLQTGRSKSFGPCPACNEDKRSGDDRRGPCGHNRGGWKCHRCGVKGDAVELVSLKLFGPGKPSREQMGELREFCEAEGWCQPGENRPEKLGVQSWRQKRTKKGGRGRTLGGGGSRMPERAPKSVDPGPSPGDGSGRRKRTSFSWRPELAKEASDRLWTEEGKAALTYLTEVRALTEDTIRFFGLGVLIVGPSETWITIPLLDGKEQLQNVRFRRIPDADGSCPKPKYRVCSGRHLPLFGSHLLGNDLDAEVLLTEGEFDCMALYQYGFERDIGSTSGGAGTFKPEWLDDLEPYRGFVLLYDDDEAGDEGVDVAAEVLGAYRCSTATLPFNDVNACLQEGVPVEAIESAIDKAESLVGVHLRTAADFHAQLETLIENPQELIGRSTGSDKLDEVMGGMRPGLWVVTGPSGHGKTTFVTWLCLNQAKIGMPVGLTSFEQQPIGTFQKILRMQLGRNFIEVSREDRKRAVDELDDLPLYFIDHYGRMPLPQLMETIRYALRRFGVRVFMIDHLHFLLDGAEDERREIDETVRSLATLSVTEGITIILIAHPDKSHSREGRRVRLGDLKGSSAIEQDAHMGIVVQRAKLTAQRKWPAARIYVDKARSEFACPGSNRLMAFDPDACVYADSFFDTPMGRVNPGLVEQGGADRAAEADNDDEEEGKP